MKAVIVLALGLMGCSVNNGGLLLAEVIPAAGAVVVDTYQLGGSIRTAQYDAGVSFGISRRSYIYPAGLTDLPENGWHWLYVPLPQCRPIAFMTQTYGLEANSSAPELFVTVGYEAATIMTYLPKQASVTYRLSYSTDHPESTSLSECGGIEGC